MTEDEAKAWVAEGFGAAAVDRLQAFADLLAAANATQNLIAPSTLPSLWSRHLVDSAQLVGWAGSGEGAWLDIGSGGGLPGLVVALLTERAMILSEPRRLRAQFLRDAAAALGIADRVEVHATRVERLSTPVAIISARAVASIDALLVAAAPCAARDTRWLLQRGQGWADEIQGSRLLRRGSFHVEQSLTDANARILIVTGKPGR